MKISSLLVLILILAVAAIALAQGEPELTSNKNAFVDGFAPKTITKYYHTKAAVSIPLAGNVSKYCIYPSAAGTVQYNGTGDARPIAATTDFCRTVRKGVTSITFTGASSAKKTIYVEKQF
jgi:hypothetical protein